MATKERPASLPPYISYSTFVNLLDWLKEMQVVPRQWDRSLWESKFSGSVGSQVASALRSLGLLDGDMVTTAMEQLALAEGSQREGMIRDILVRTYGADFISDIARKTPKNIDDHLRSLGATEATVDRAKAFFVKAATSVGITVPQSVAKKVRKQSSGKGKGSQIRPPREERDSGVVNHDEGHARRVVQTGEDSLSRLHPLVMVLVRDLEKKGSSWNREQRDAWMKIFESNLDYAYPAKEETKEGKAQ